SNTVAEGTSYPLTLYAPSGATWSIDWGDGTTSSDPTHTYLDGDHQYAIKATATVGSDVWAADPWIVKVLNVAPTPVLVGSPEVNEGSIYNLQLSVTDPGHEQILRWSIDWGDGTGQNMDGDPTGTTAVNHVYVNGTNTYVIRA